MIHIKIDELKSFLLSPKNIIITTHFKPDGDAIGSSLGLYFFLKKLGHNCHIIVPSGVPDFLTWLSGTSEIINFESQKELAISKLNDAELISCLDFNKLDRTHDLKDHISNNNAPKMIIDHHLLPDLDLFDYGFSNPDKSSTAEMVYDFIHWMEGQSLFNEEIMEALYTGVMTDTGSFRFPSTTASVHKMIADFKDRGFKHSLVHENVYDVWSLERMRLLGYLLNEKMTVFADKGYGYIFLSKQELNRFNAGLNDTEGIVNYILSVKNIKVAIFITERNEGLKLSFRSKGNIDVNSFANKYFNGGGHFNAAGATSSLDWAHTKSIIEEKIPLLIENN